jgi:hypothetical protein
MQGRKRRSANDAEKKPDHERESVEKRQWHGILLAPPFFFFPLFFSVESTFWAFHCPVTRQKGGGSAKTRRDSNGTTAPFSLQISSSQSSGLKLPKLPKPIQLVFLYFVSLVVIEAPITSQFQSLEVYA